MLDVLPLSETFRLCIVDDKLEPDRGSTADLGVDMLADFSCAEGLCSGSVAILGDILASDVAESGVGRVDTDDASDEVVDDGVVMSLVDENVGVEEDFALGDSSGRADRASPAQPDRSRLRDSCLFKGARADIWLGIMRGGRSFGDGGGRMRPFGTLFSLLWNP